MGDIGSILQKTKGFIDCMYILAQEGAALEGKQLTEDRSWFARHCPVNGDFRAYATAAMINAIVAGMEMESDKDTQEEVDVVLEDLKKRDGNRLTYRMCCGYGLIAGLGYTEMRTMSPGLVMDLFVCRRTYDDQQHGIRREKPQIYD